MSRKEPKQLFTKIGASAGPEGLKLAQTIASAFIKDGKGLSGIAVVDRLADEVQKGNIRLQHKLWIYRDLSGEDQVLGGPRDEVLPELVNIATILHEKPLSYRKYARIDAWRMGDTIKKMGERVQNQINRRERNEKIRTWFTDTRKRILGF
jgi:hypothetical protein